MRRWGDERRGDRFEDRRGSRDSPEVAVLASSDIMALLCFQENTLDDINTNLSHLFIFVKQRERKRRNSDRSEDGYHSDGDYPEQDYRREPGEEKKSKTIMLWGLSPHVTEEDVSLHFSSSILI